MQETRVPSLGWEDLLEEEMATHSSILAWRIPWTEDPGGLQSMGSQRDTTKVTQHAHTQAHTTPATGCGIVCEGWRWGGVLTDTYSFQRRKRIVFISLSQSSMIQKEELL